MKPIREEYLLPTDIVDSDHEAVIQYAMDNSGEPSGSDLQKAVNLYYSIRDDIRYNPYAPFWLPEHFRASNVLKKKNGLCIAKAVLLCAAVRACGIPSRLGYADVRNHLATKELIDVLGSGNFVYHSFTEIYLEGKWVKATPAFDRVACKRHRVAPLDFNGKDDSLYHLYNTKKELFMEYLKFHGNRPDVPVDEIVNAFILEYGHDRVEAWKREWEKFKRYSRDFYSEKVTDEIIER